MEFNSIQKKALDPDSDYLPLTNESIEIVEEAVRADRVYGNEANGNELEAFFRNCVDNRLNANAGNSLNSKRNIILHKIMLIDYTYSTNLSKQKSRISIFELADIIEGIGQLDERIKDGDEKVVDDMLKIIYDKKRVNLFSFVSKYCTINNCDGYQKDSFSIYDNIIEKAIPQYLKIESHDGKDIIKKKIKEWKDGRKYSYFHSLISRMIEVYELKTDNKEGKRIRRMLDHFLWYPNRPIKDKVAIERFMKTNKIAEQVLMPSIDSGIVHYPVKLNHGKSIENINDKIEDLKKALHVENTPLLLESGSDIVRIAFPIKSEDKEFLERLLNLREKIIPPKNVVITNY